MAQKFNITGHTFFEVFEKAFVDEGLDYTQSAIFNFGINGTTAVLKSFVLPLKELHVQWGIGDDTGLHVHPHDGIISAQRLLLDIDRLLGYAINIGATRVIVQKLPTQTAIQIIEIQFVKPI